jgi:predicted amidohydrolase YtcJ
LNGRERPISDQNSAPDLILHRGLFTMLDRSNPTASAVAIKNGVFTAVGRDNDVLPLADRSTRIIDLKGRRTLPGLIDNHLHIIRGGLNFNMELRWDGVRSLADAMAMLKRQVAATPPPQRVRVVGGFTAHQFAEKRLPTIEELNAVAPDTPVFLLHLYDRAFLNGAALRAVGYTKDTPAPPAGEIVRDASGNPTGLLLAKPNAAILYATLAKGPKLPLDYQINSTRHFMRELNRLGLTGAIDAGGGFQNYPEDYEVIRKLSEAGQLTVRLAYNLFTQKPKGGKIGLPQLDQNLEIQAGGRLLPSQRRRRDVGLLGGRFRRFSPASARHASGNGGRTRGGCSYPRRESLAMAAACHLRRDNLTRARRLRAVNQDIPLSNLNWFFDHAETISDESIERIAALGGGIAVQHRMAYQGEYFVERYGLGAAEATPPITRMIAAGVKVSAGTDATRVASYNPWVSLAWLATGRTVAGLRIYPPRNCLDRETALRMWTENVTWFSNEEGKKGRTQVGQFADLMVPDRDYFSCAEEEIADTTSELTVVGGKVVYGAGDFASLDETELPPAMPDWSPVRTFGGFAAWGDPNGAGKHAFDRKLAMTCGCANACGIHGHEHANAWSSKLPIADLKTFWGALGCACWAV